MYLVETEQVVKRYADHLALDRVNIAVPEGKIFGLLGPNGAGKTTLIRIINRITLPDSGCVWFASHASQPDDVLQIGYLPEERGLYKKMKVGEQAIYLAQLKGLSYKEAHERLKYWFEKFNILPWWNRKVEELSKEMQQKVQFVITVIHEPKLLIFDEPFSGFDPINADLLKREILELKEKGHTIIFSTHNMASVEEICDEIALINHSQVVLSGQVDEVRNRFKQHTFTLSYTDERVLQTPAEGYEILSESRRSSGVTELRIRKEASLSNTDLLLRLAKRYEILSFAEELPSMNDIFIQIVSSTSQTQAAL